MFSCERCGSLYSATRVAEMRNCPRCQVRDRVSVPLYFKPFTSITQASKRVDDMTPVLTRVR